MARVKQIPAAKDKVPTEQERWKFQPISSAKAFQEVVDQITYAIRSGVFAPGDRLPQIEELARDMHVSRVTVGDALKILNNAGVLKSRRGLHGGTTVQSTEVSEIKSEFRRGRVTASRQELIDARRCVEFGIARLAAERATEEDFAAMEQTIRQLQECSNESYVVRVHYDHLFHYAMARAARCDMLARYQHEVLEELFVVMRKYFSSFNDVGLVADLHRKTLEALRSRDLKRVDEVMNHHLSYLEHG